MMTPQIALTLAIIVAALVIGLVLFAGINISLAMVMGAVGMVLTRCLTMEEACESIDYARIGALLTVCLFIVTMIALPLFFPLFP